MPFKVENLNYIDKLSPEVEKIGSCNTVVNEDGHLTAYNTDYYGVKTYIEKLNTNIDVLYIAGNGGFSKSIQYASKLLGIKYEVICRKEWYKLIQLKNEWIFNATPVDLNIKENFIIDGRPYMSDGKLISLNQSILQLKIYTGMNYYE